MNLYLPTAHNSNNDPQDLLDLYDRFGFEDYILLQLYERFDLSNQSAELRMGVGVLTFSEFRERATRNIPDFQKWCDDNTFQEHADDVKMRFTYQYTCHYLKMLCEAVNPEFHENMDRWRAHRDTW